MRDSNRTGEFENPVKRYCITDSLDVALGAAAKGATMVQIRAKQLSAREQFTLVQRAVAGIPVPVNSRAGVALAAGAHGEWLIEFPPASLRIL